MSHLLITSYKDVWKLCNSQVDNYVKSKFLQSLLTNDKFIKSFMSIDDVEITIEKIQPYLLRDEISYFIINVSVFIPQVISLISLTENYQYHNIIRNITNFPILSRRQKELICEYK